MIILFESLKVVVEDVMKNVVVFVVLVFSLFSSFGFKLSKVTNKHLPVHKQVR